MSPSISYHVHCHVLQSLSAGPRCLRPVSCIPLSSTEQSRLTTSLFVRTLTHSHSTAACIYKKTYLAARPSSSGGPASTARELSAEDNAKLVFGTVFSLRNMVRKLGGDEDSFVSYRTSHYKLHFYETPTNLKFVMVTDTKMNNLRIVLHQIYVSLYVEYVVKNPLSPVEHVNGEGVDCELFEVGLEQFLVSA